MDEDVMPPVAAVVIALIGLVLVFSAVWAWQLKSENAGMVGPVWAYSLGAVAVLYAVLGARTHSTTKYLHRFFMRIWDRI
jgi:steroid 5-alpha reductase family enzyme